MSSSDPQNPVLLTPTALDAFDGVRITLHLGGKTFPAILSATTAAVTFSLTTTTTTNDATQPTTIELTYPWVDVLMHSTMDEESMFVVISAPKHKLPLAWVRRNCPGIDFYVDPAEESGCDEEDMLGPELDNTAELSFTILTPPTTAFPLVYNDTMQLLALAENQPTEPTPTAELTPKQQEEILDKIRADKTQLVYHLFSQCIRLNPDNLAQGDDESDALAGFANMMNVLDAMEMPDEYKMFTAEDFMGEDEDGQEGDDEDVDLAMLYGMGFVEKDEDHSQRYERSRP